jgi:hypothetical protein
MALHAHLQPKLLDLANQVFNVQITAAGNHAGWLAQCLEAGTSLGRLKADVATEPGCL